MLRLVILFDGPCVPPRIRQLPIQVVRRYRRREPAPRGTLLILELGMHLRRVWCTPTHLTMPVPAYTIASFTQRRCTVRLMWLERRPRPARPYRPPRPAQP